MQKPEEFRNPTRPEFSGFSWAWHEKPEILLSEPRPDPDLTIRVRVFSRVSRVFWTLKCSKTKICSTTGMCSITGPMV